MPIVYQNHIALHHLEMSMEERVHRKFFLLFFDKQKLREKSFFLNCIAALLKLISFLLLLLFVKVDNVLDRNTKFAFDIPKHFYIQKFC